MLNLSYLKDPKKENRKSKGLLKFVLLYNYYDVNLPKNTNIRGVQVVGFEQNSL